MSIGFEMTKTTLPSRLPLLYESWNAIKRLGRAGNKGA
jgi:hypothetical protein